MRSLFTSRLFRCVVCLVLICCVLVQISPLRVKATAVAPAIVKGAVVTGNPYVIVGAGLIALGVWAVSENKEAFQEVVDNAVSYLESTGEWIQDGAMELLQTVDSTGHAMYYAAGDLLETLRGWLFDSSVVHAPASYAYGTEKRVYCNGANYFISTNSESCYFNCIALMDGPSASGTWAGDFLILSSEAGGVSAKRSNGNSVSLSYLGKHNSMYVYRIGSSSSCSLSSIYYFDFIFDSSANFLGVEGYIDNSVSADLSLGHLPSQDTELDDTTIVAFHPYLANVVRTRTGGSGDSGNDGEHKWWLGLAFAETMEKLYETNQRLQIETPSVTEIPDIQVGIEYDITEEEDEDGNKYLVLDPSTGTGSNPGTGTDPDTGEGTDPDTGTNTDPDTGNGSGDGSGSNTGSDSGGSNTGNSWSPPSNHNQFALADLSKFFPFCIPFDLYAFFQLLDADPVAPVFHWEIQDLAGQTYALTVDLSEWDSVAQLFRRLQLFLFVCGLAAASRKYIKW